MIDCSINGNEVEVKIKGETSVFQFEEETAAKEFQQSVSKVLNSSVNNNPNSNIHGR